MKNIKSYAQTFLKRDARIPLPSPPLPMDPPNSSPVRVGRASENVTSYQSLIQCVWSEAQKTEFLIPLHHQSMGNFVLRKEKDNDGFQNFISYLWVVNEETQAGGYIKDSP